MIGRLKGTLAEKQPPHLILDVNGVGYELEVPMTTLYRLPAVGQGVTLHTHLVVREDALTLFGFESLEEREFFNLLLSVNGVGPRTALNILSTHPTNAHRVEQLRKALPGALALYEQARADGAR